MIPYGTNLRLKHLPWVTLTILAINWMIFVFHQRFDYKINFWISRTFCSIPGEFIPWQLITSAFLHSSFLHILGNSLYLLVFGPFVEEKIGWKDFLFLYLLTAVVSDLVQNTMTGIFMRETLFIPSLGASGAISGIMGVYLFRCYYSKIKLMIDLFIPIKFKLPAYVILPLWFLQDFIGGIDSTRGIYQNIGFWAHVGGFAAGFSASQYLQYGKRARKEKLEFIAETSLPQYGGYGEGIEAAEKLLKENPNEPELNLELARTLSRWRPTPEGKEHYERAIKLFLKIDPEKSSEIFTEYWGQYLTLLDPPTQLRLCLLLEKKNPSLSAITLQSLIEKESPGDLFMEEAHLHLARIYRRELGQNELARAIYEKFLQRFPKSRKREFVEKALLEMEKISK